ncbi:hypothetical protein AJ80_03594 [Polytolypa hystricis UAMH7299]|uniref:Uncharacterized protein n=1 Tax=Polytolypa hystricis (strain UAMH7299) TaxID=1447883 RepID=A0A2B7YIA3_POLH7|nr:hypothetical protein AJ80_03594 [Polytolypa hystricis UAMH7299]
METSTSPQTKKGKSQTWTTQRHHRSCGTGNHLTVHHNNHHHDHGHRRNDSNASDHDIRLARLKRRPQSVSLGPPERLNLSTNLDSQWLSKETPVLRRRNTLRSFLRRPTSGFVVDFKCNHDGVKLPLQRSGGSGISKVVILFTTPALDHPKYYYHQLSTYDDKSSNIEPSHNGQDANVFPR